MLGKFLSFLENKFGGLTPFVVVFITGIISAIIYCLVYIKAPIKMSNERDNRELHQVIQNEWLGDTIINYELYPQSLWKDKETNKEWDIIPVVYDRVSCKDTIKCVSFISLKPNFLKWRIGKVLKTGENITVIESEYGVSFTNEFNWIDDYKKKFGM